MSSISSCACSPGLTGAPACQTFFFFSIKEGDLKNLQFLSAAVQTHKEAFQLQCIFWVAPILVLEFSRNETSQLVSWFYLFCGSLLSCYWRHNKVHVRVSVGTCPASHNICTEEVELGVARSFGACPPCDAETNIVHLPRKKSCTEE